MVAKFLSSVFYSGKVSLNIFVREEIIRNITDIATESSKNCDRGFSSSNRALLEAQQEAYMDRESLNMWAV